MGDVRRLAETGRLEEIISFGPDVQHRLCYVLLFSGEIAKPRATFLDGGLTVAIPKDKGIAWVESEEVGIESAQKIPGGGEIKILIEKDFACRSKTRQDENSDAFPNPLGEEC